MLTREDFRLAATYSRGASASSVAQRFGVAEGTVFAILKRAGVPTRRELRKLARERERLITRRCEIDERIKQLDFAIAWMSELVQEKLR